MTSVGEWPVLYADPGPYLAALDKAIRALDDVVMNSPDVPAPDEWRTAFSQFVIRWRIEKDSYEAWGVHRPTIDWGGRLKLFEKNLLHWVRQWEEYKLKPAKSADSSSPALWLMLGLGLFALRGRR